MPLKINNSNSMKKMDFFRAHGTENMKSIETIQFHSSFSPGQIEI
jgi:hypothetical protein